MITRRCFGRLFGFGVPALGLFSGQAKTKPLPNTDEFMDHRTGISGWNKVSSLKLEVYEKDGSLGYYWSGKTTHSDAFSDKDKWSNQVFNTAHQFAHDMEDKFGMKFISKDHPKWGLGE